ncbi:hypothetical protein JCM19241_5614 [Vibrio ishigakensis]|uniref:Uncharacterized protein n=1 Tax=Vibrio ishigakensis TaxID=1481914 RepID=A0A0B8QGX9_9VIBR|nr:hypothetical protein JCM19241_5614 [Vibrio ishigakensis]
MLTAESSWCVVSSGISVLPKENGICRFTRDSISGLRFKN